MCRSETKKSSIHWRPSTYEECVACHSHGERLLVPRHRPWPGAARVRAAAEAAVARVTPLIGYTKDDRASDALGCVRQVFASEEDADTRAGDVNATSMFARPSWAR